jgi:uncharacterized membrane protein
MRIAPSSAVTGIPALFLTGCAGPLGPAFDVGPDAKFFAGFLAVLLLSAFFYRFTRTKADADWQGSSAAHIVRERYARGEMTREEYQHMMRDLFTPIERLK